MKVYVVTECFRDWESGWDNVVGVYASKEKAQDAQAKFEEENTNDLTCFYYEEQELIE